MAKVPKKRIGSSVDPNEAKRFCVDNVAVKLSDLNEDVLLKIFSYLNEEEMINIVKARGLFLATCQQAFKLKYRNKYIEISLHLDYRHYIDLLGYFGKNITKLQLQYSWANKEKRSRIHDLVLETCHDTLIEIHIIGISAESKIDKCFKKLKTLHIAHGSVDNSVCQFGKWFPRMEDLRITSITNIDTKFNVRRQIPSLKRFSMVFSKNCSDLHMLRVCKLNNFMNRNPQLSEICLTLSDTHNDTVVDRINMVDDAAANAKQLSNLKLELVYTRGLYSEELAQLMVPKGSIEHLELTTNRLNEQTCEFMKSCSNLKSLTLVIDFLRICFMADQLFRSTAWLDSTKHVQLTELTICFYAEVRFLAIDTLNVALLAVEPFMKHCRNLSTVTIKYKLGHRSTSFVGEFNKNVSYDALKNRINLGVWSFTTFTPFDFDNGLYLKFKRL